jgi:prephenate dehydrogenase
MSLKGRCSTLLSLHPLFGPGVRNIKRKRIVWIPQSDPEREEAVARRLFPGATFIRATGEVHDRMVAITLGLTHFVNAVFAGIVEQENVENLREFGGTSFALQLLVSQTVLRDNASLLASIQVGNRYGPEYVERFLTEATRLARLAKSDRKGTEQFFESVRERMQGDPKFESSYRKAYSLVESLLDT